ncbi:hypothetical protein N566_00360 [Streptomycetaceae bacterium MP113-05]|nr:hypothetical protein N566_00360 [Streptomycetaceae bacterium MP113-05]
MTVGLDGSRESAAAVDWAAREALLRGARLDIVQVRDTGPYPYSPILDDQVERDWGEQTTREAEAALARRYPALETTAQLYSGRPSKVLDTLSESSELLVLGSRGVGPVTGFVVGSVGLPAVAHAHCPVILVRNRPVREDESGDGEPPRGDVVIGLKTLDPPEEPLGFAFETAARWDCRLIAVHGWELPPSYGLRPIPVEPGLTEELTREKSEALRTFLLPWQAKYPSVRTEARTDCDWPARQLLLASTGAGLVVVGRRARSARVGTHLGSVAHAVLHHAAMPVAVVPHV